MNMENNIYTTHPTKIVNKWCIDPAIMPIDLKNVPQDYFSMIPHFFYEFNNNDNVHIILAAPQGRLLYQNIDIIRNHIRENTNEHTILCFDNLNEGNIRPEILRIHQSIENIISPNAVYYFSAACNAKEIYNKICIEHNITNPINVYACNTWEYFTKKNSNITVQYNIKQKEKNYLCFNRITRPHRIALLALLHQHDLVNRGYYSFFSNNAYWINPNITHDTATINSMENKITPDLLNNIRANYNSILPQLPLLLNTTADENKNYVSDTDIQYFDNSYYSLVTETYFFEIDKYDTIDEEGIFFTEKTYKPILMKHPFIILHKPYTLQKLKEYGYRTFAPYINEAYDNEPDHQKRLLMIVDEVIRLSKFTDNQWLEWQHNVAPIVEHNFEIIMNRKKYEYAIR